MAMAAVADITSGASRTIGRYFTVVSVVPSFVLVGWTFLISATGAWTGEPELEEIPTAFGKLGIGGAVALAGVAIIIALAVHPIQFALVQLLEGYWGPSRVGRLLRARRTMTHLRIRARLEEDSTSVADPEATLAKEGVTDAQVRVALDEAIRVETDSTLQAGYPDALAATLPTRLGNVLRRYELRTGSGYGLSLLESATALVLVAEPSHVAYLNDRRSDLDLAVRMSATFLVATAVTFAAYVPHGLWLIAALVPYLGAWLCYRGAVTVAADYGRALVALSDLNRFRLYQQLHLPQPIDTDAERTLNEQWGYVASAVPDSSVGYKHPQ